jgi:hypothetical protein
VAHPDDPGVAHFLIHSYDHPPRAEKGLAAARRYASIAPSAAHALHMPSHIFTRVRELLGDMLLELGQPALALTEYEASQRREPNRFRGLYGAATAAAKSGEAATAELYFRKLAALAQKGEDRPELRQAKQ